MFVCRRFVGGVDERVCNTNRKVYSCQGSLHRFSSKYSDDPVATHAESGPQRSRHDFGFWAHAALMIWETGLALIRLEVSGSSDQHVLLSFVNSLSRMEKNLNGLMSFEELKARAAADPGLAARLSSAVNLGEIIAIAKDQGVTLDLSELASEELSLQELSAASGGIRMMLASRLGLSGGLGKLSGAASSDDTTDGCPTWDLDKCTVSTEKGSSPSCI